MTLGNGVIEIGESVWANDEALEEVTFPKTLQMLGGYAFFRCCNLLMLWNFSDMSGLSTLGEKTFKHCRARREGWRKLLRPRCAQSLIWGVN